VFLDASVYRAVLDGVAVAEFPDAFEAELPGASNVLAFFFENEALPHSGHQSARNIHLDLLVWFLLVFLVLLGFD